MMPRGRGITLCFASTCKDVGHGQPRAEGARRYQWFREKGHSHGCAGWQSGASHGSGTAAGHWLRDGGCPCRDGKAESLLHRSSFSTSMVAPVAHAQGNM
jgi:hypothetical protein